MTNSELEAMIANLQSELKRLSQVATNLPVRLAPSGGGPINDWRHAKLSSELNRGSPDVFTQAECKFYKLTADGNSYELEDETRIVYDVGFVISSGVPTNTLIKVVKRKQKWFYDGHDCTENLDTGDPET